MTYHHFPDTAFAWTFYVLLVGFLTVAAYTDLRWITIPKGLTLTALALGIIFNIVRGAVMGPDLDREGLILEGPEGVFAGALDGLLFSLAGFGAGFGMFLLMWMLGTCGGGDVKLFAALSAWVGPLMAVIILAGTVLVVFLISIGRLAWSMATQGMKPTMRNYSARAAARSAKFQNKKPGKKGQFNAPTPRQRLTTYSLPVALSTAVILGWVFKYDLHLKERPSEKQAEGRNAIDLPAKKRFA
jgi:Flp pilus assembly protein protease CpaA